jgi:hypothetical protein
MGLSEELEGYKQIADGIFSMDEESLYPEVVLRRALS